MMHPVRHHGLSDRNRNMIGCVVYASLSAGTPAVSNDSATRLIAPFSSKTLLAFPIFSFSFFYTPVLFPM
jgi:amino acid permease